MPALLIFALAASLGLHTVALFLPEVDLSFPVEPPPLSAELKTPAPSPPARATAPAAAVPAPPPPARQ
ncbi:MAG TPA: serine/threonine protein kinase, partial [Candidatus Accumulibacter phosphatis]|nr:serine/threonine protein kinase [Candidatus Accumulibacter phosphatis]